MTHTGPVACMRVPICVCVCVCVSRIHCHAHASATVWRHKGGVLVNGILVGAPRRRRGEQHVEKGSCRGDVHPRGTLHPFASLSANLALGRLKSAHGLPLSVFLSPPCTENHLTSLSGEKLDERGIEAFDFRHPFQREIRIWESLNGRNVSLCGGFWEGGFVSCSFYEKEKKKKLCCTLWCQKLGKLCGTWRRKRFLLYKRGCKLIFLDIDNLSKRNERNFASAILILRWN